MVEFIQCLGRKRVQDKKDTVKLYFYDNFSKIAGLYSCLAMQMQVAAEYFQLSENGLIDDFKNKYRLAPLPNFFDNKSDLVFRLITKQRMIMNFAVRLQRRKLPCINKCR